MIMLWLPIDKHLMTIAQSGRTFSSILLNDWSFSKTHVNARATTHFYETIKTLRHCLPISYVSALYHTAFEDRNLDWRYKKAILTFSASLNTSNLERIAAHLCKALPKSALPDLLEWICTWRMPWPMQTLLEVVKRYPDIPTPFGFVTKALFYSWKEIVEVMVQGGLDVSARNYEAFIYAFAKDDCEMMAILLQDRRVDLSVHDYVFCQKAKSLVMAETILSDARIPNGEFLISICRGDVEAVTNYPPLSESNFSSIKALCLFFAVRFNQSAVLHVLLNKEQFTDYSYEPGASESWTQFRRLFNDDEYALCATNWFIVQILSSKSKLSAPSLELFKKFGSECEVRDVMGQHRKWEFLLEMAFLFESRELFEFVFTNPGSGNSPQVIRAVLRFANQTRLFGMLDYQACRELFQPVLVEDPCLLLNILKDPCESIGDYLLSNDQKFFSIAYLQRAFDVGCRLHCRGSTSVLVHHPEIQVSNQQAETVEFLMNGDPKDCDLYDCEHCKCEPWKNEPGTYKPTFHSNP
ncbi:hypothetical protein HDU81_006764 [Chytriomyces hyalinus]|nr:hypothetical protein HDU81_006764 [Chytriomyces hyalinus]